MSANLGCVVPEVVAPTSLEIVPAPGATNVDPFTSRLRVLFDEDVSTGTLQARLLDINRLTSTIITFGTTGGTQLRNVCVQRQRVARGES
jgi:hypothetical protein